MACADRFGFSLDGKFLSCVGESGRLKIWDTETGTLKQEYIPDQHLTSSCTCLVWMRLSRESITPKKKKKLKIPEDGVHTDIVAVGTVLGRILLYSVASGDLIGRLEDDDQSAVKSVTWVKGSSLFSCSGVNVVEWNIANQQVKNKWKAGSEPLACLLALPGGGQLLAASCNISLWSLPKWQLLKTFTGHPSPVSAMVLLPAAGPGLDSYFVSVCSTDRYLSAWSLNTKLRPRRPVAQMLMEDVAVNLAVSGSAEQPAVCAVTRSGVLHLYRPHLNGRSEKPVKPQVTLQVAAESEGRPALPGRREAVEPLPVAAAHLGEDASVLLAFGTVPVLAFERVKPSGLERVVCLVRKDPRKAGPPPSNAFKVKEPMMDGPAKGLEARYLGPLSLAAAGAVGVASAKRRRGCDTESGAGVEVPMEARLDNLSLHRAEPRLSSSGTPRADNVAQLLLHALSSRDRHTLASALAQRDEAVVRRTVARLPAVAARPLLAELAILLQGKQQRARTAARWLRALVAVHAGQLLAGGPGALEPLAPLLGLVEARLALQQPLARLRGRLELLLEQTQAVAAGTGAAGAAGDPDVGLLAYQDTYTSDEEGPEGSLRAESAANSESDDHWEDFSEDEQEAEAEAEQEGEGEGEGEEEEGDGDSSDEAMSS